jgi:hypothetical protein
MYSPDTYAQVVTRVTWRGPNDLFANAITFPVTPFGVRSGLTISNIHFGREPGEPGYPGLWYMPQWTMWYNAVIPAGATRMWVREAVRCQCA